MNADEQCSPELAWRLEWVAGMPCVLVAPIPSADPERSSVWLTPDEQRTAERLANGRRRADWLAGRVAAKLALREALDGRADPSELTVEYEPSGRPVPRLGGRALGRLSLTISHSRGWGLAAASKGPRAIGVDLEHASPDLAQLGEFVLSPVERARVPSPPPAEAVLVCWTLKEAALKALGTGLRVHPRRVEAYTDCSARAGEARWRLMLPMRPASSGVGWFRREAKIAWALAAADSPRSAAHD